MKNPWVLVLFFEHFDAHPNRYPYSIVYQVLHSRYTYLKINVILRHIRGPSCKSSEVRMTIMSIWILSFFSLLASVTFDFFLVMLSRLVVLPSSVSPIEQKIIMTVDHHAHCVQINLFVLHENWTAKLFPIHNWIKHKIFSQIHWFF